MHGTLPTINDDLGNSIAVPVVLQSTDREGNIAPVLGTEDGLVTQNFLTKFRDSFRDYNTTDNWTEVSKGSGDIIQTAANAVLNVACGTTGSNVLVNAQGYFAP